ncbi:MAG: CYTH domain-containing protein [Bacteroidales bacterium]|jgi:adenylate cyclase|nr:CYTH domain-containing protein [Bacteroidales bacterium]MDD3130557.1 CYTH domain-containing protein [Bacteroidales bacterium]NLO51136.1 CYTH domain-containing protein [Bacteroidales bacterium]
MAKEIERKFLVKGDFSQFVTKKTRIIQGYLSSVPERTVRVRVKGDSGYITIKGIGSASGASRYEWEKQITLEEAQELMALCEPGIIDKTRYIVPASGGLKFEVDEFYGENEGLTVAEIELPSEGHQFEKPQWLGQEVTGDARYYNSVLMKNPYKNW